MDRLAELPSQDARDYIPITKFVKTAQALDLLPPDDFTPPWPWEKVTAISSGFISETDRSLVVTGIHSSEGRGHRMGIIILSKDYERGIYSSQHLPDLDDYKWEAIAEAVRTACLYLPDRQRAEYSRLVGKDPILYKGDTTQVREMVARRILAYVPTPAEPGSFEALGLDLEDFNQNLNESQIVQLTDYLKLVCEKLPVHMMTQLREKMINDYLKISLGAFRDNYRFIFREVLAFALKTREDLSPDTNALKPKRPTLKFPLENFITRPIASIDQMVEILSNMPATSLPRDLLYGNIPQVAEFVDIDRIIGGRFNKDTNRGTFLGNAQEGAVRLFRMLTDLSSGGRVINEDTPIEVVEYRGAYYVSDGHHRVAVLKALGVSFAPMMVTRVS